MTSPQTPQARPRAGRFVRNVRWQLVANGAQALLGGLYLIVLGRYLGASAFGLFSVVMALTTVAGQTLELRLQDVVARDFCHLDDAGAERHGDEGLRLLDLLLLETGARLLPCLGLLAVSPWLAQFSRLPDDAMQLLLVATAGFVLSKSCWGVTTGLLRVLGRTDLIALCLSADWGGRLLATLLVVWFGQLNVLGALTLAALVGGAFNLLQLLLSWREFQRRVGLIAWRRWTPTGAVQRMRSQRRLIVSNMGVSMSDLMAKDLDMVLISGMLSAEKVGVYKMAKSLVQALWKAVEPFYLAMMPEVQRLWQRGEHASLRQLLRKSSVRLLTLALGLTVIGVGAVATFGPMALGPAYAGLHQPMLVMCLWMLVCAPLLWGFPLSIAIGCPELNVVASVLGSVVGLAAFAGLTPVLGLEGAAAAWSLTLATTFAFTAVVATRRARRMTSSA